MRVVAISIFALLCFDALASGIGLPPGYPASVTLYVGVGSSSSVVLTWTDASAYQSGDLRWNLQPNLDNYPPDVDWSNWLLSDQSNFAQHSFSWDGSTSSMGWDESSGSFSSSGPIGGGPSSQPTTQPNVAEEESAQSLQSIKCLLANILGASFFVVMRWSMQRRETWN